MPGIHVVVCGGGVAGVEALLRLRRLGGDGLRLTLTSPNIDFVYRPLAVGAPFGRSSSRRYPLEGIAADVGARWLRDRLSSVDPLSRTVYTEGGANLTYDALLLAVGARESTSYEHALCFTDRESDQTFHGIIRDIDLGCVNRVVFVLPHEWVWPLPLYELALMTAAHARSTDAEVQLTFVTAEGRPLKAFGAMAGNALLRRLDEAGVALHTGVVAEVPSPNVVTCGDLTLVADRIVTLPRITGPAIRGIPAGTRWFVPIDEWCTVVDTGGRVFAAGDATDFPVKQGGIGAQQADSAAAGIAHLAGLGERPPPLNPVIRGTLLTGERPLYMSAGVVKGLGWHSEIYEQPPWQADEKIVAEELGPYLRTLESTPAGSAIERRKDP